ncbi:MAG: amidohydrolase family protein [Planctomycetaceae bacterium]|nr:amidohydrolase family protein [Planctomycetaceae bacterium]
MPDVDLLIRAGRIVCTRSGIDGPGAVAIRSGRIVATGPQVGGAGTQTIDLPDAVLLPGLIDFHAHPARSGSKYGVDPDVEFLPRGVTTVLSQGDAGADNWPEYRAGTIDASNSRVRLALNLSRFGEPPGGACFRVTNCIDRVACASAVADGDELIWGISVNLSRESCALDPRWVLQHGLAIATECGKPLLVGMRNPSDWPIREQLALLRSGDVVTYLFRDGEWSIIGKDGRVLPEVRDARERGILFDACHGLQSFSFRAAEAAIADGFLPDTISTDQYARHVGSNPPHHLPRTMSKLLAAGMTELDVFARVGAHPAALLGLSHDIGSLEPGSCADLTALVQRPSAAPLVDCRDDSRPGLCWESVLVVRAGTIVAPQAIK